MTTQIKKIIAEMRKKEKAASEGVWELRPSSDNRPYIFQKIKNDLGPLIKTYRHNLPGSANADFIVYARNNITAILDYVERLEKLNSAKRCPNCPDQGWYEVRGTEGPEQERCQWCDITPDSLFNVEKETGQS